MKKYLLSMTLIASCFLLFNVNTAEAKPAHKKMPVRIEQQRKNPAIKHKNRKSMYYSNHHKKGFMHPKQKRHHIYPDNRVCINLPGLYISF